MSLPQGTKLNVQILVAAEKDIAAGWLVFQPRGTHFRPGRNELSFCATVAGANSTRLADILHVEVPVKYKSRSQHQVTEVVSSLGRFTVQLCRARDAHLAGNFSCAVRR